MEKGRESFALKADSLETGHVAGDKGRKIEEYFNVKKNQRPKIEDIDRPKETAEDDNISKVERELKSAREKYISANFETNIALAKIKKFLHVKENLGNREALDLKYSRYKNKLNELLSLKIDELKSQNPGSSGIGEKIRDLVENFNSNEEASLSAARAKFEPQQEEVPKNNKQATPKNIGPAPESLPDSAGDDSERNSAVILENLMECIKENAAIFGKKWEGIRSMNVYKVARDMNWRKNNELDIILRKLQETLGSEVRPGGLETVEKWIERVSKLAAEKSR